MNAEGPGNWVYRAACAGADLSLPHSGREATEERQARRTIAHYCERCPVLDDCRTWALGTPDPAAGHIAGGLTPRQRSKVRRGIIHVH